MVEADVTHDRQSYYYFALRRRGKSENRKIDGLQRHTADVTECAWPDCDRSTPETFEQNRLGVLCLDHAWSHYDAMNQYLVWDGTTDSALAKDFRARQVPLDQITDEERAERKAILEQGQVYYLLVGERVKIGFSGTLHQRLRTYPPGSKLLAVEPGTKQLERQRHRQFGEYLVAGREWFEPSDELLAHTRDLANQHGKPDYLQPRYREPLWRQERKQPMRYAKP